MDGIDEVVGDITRRQNAPAQYGAAPQWSDVGNGQMGWKCAHLAILPNVMTNLIGLIWAAVDAACPAVPCGEANVKTEHLRDFQRDPPSSLASIKAQAGSL